MDRRRQFLLAGAVLGSCAIAAIVLVATAPSVEQRPPPEALRSVRVVEAQPRTVRLRVSSQGTVAPRVQTELIPEISGRVVWVSPALAAGGFFQTDDPLIRIDAADYQTALKRARARVVRAASEHTHAQRMLERRQNLATHEYLSPAQREDAERAERVAYAELEEARAAAEEAARNLKRTEISAPFVGRVRDEQIDVGQFVARGDSIATLYAIDQAEVRLPVPDRELAFLDAPLGRAQALGTEGPEVTLSASFGGQLNQWTGQIVRIEGEIDPRTRVVHVVARVDDPYGLRSDSDRAPLAVGLFVKAVISGRAEPGISILPRSAVREGPRVLVVDAANRLRSRPVELLRIDRDQALIRSGLAAGERVCISDLPVFVEGMEVRPVPAREPTTEASG